MFSITKKDRHNVINFLGIKVKLRNKNIKIEPQRDFEKDFIKKILKTFTIEIWLKMLKAY